MKKNEYVSPDMEIVEIKGLCNILAGSFDGDYEDGNEDGGGHAGPSIPGL